MPAPRLASVATAVLLALLSPAPASAVVDCAPALHRPLPVGPLRGFAVESGFMLQWDDVLNEELNVPLDSYLVFRAPPGSDTAEFLDQVDDLQRDYLDDTAGSSDFVYWVVAHNCEGLSLAIGFTSNIVCADWDLNIHQSPPLESAWANTGCTVGGECRIDYTEEDLVQRTGCGLG